MWSLRLIKRALFVDQIFTSKKMVPGKFGNLLKTKSGHMANKTTELSYPTGSALSKMSSNNWIKAQILTRLAKSDGHLNKLTYCLTSCLCQMKLTTSFCQKCQKIWLFQSFFRMDQTVDMCLWESGREGQERKKVCCGRVGIFVFITWPWFLLFWRLLQTSGGPLIDVC